jgi:hypothetical protein
MSPDDPADRDPYGTTARGDTTEDRPTLVTGAAGPAVVLPEPGYVLGELIGRGGMGEVIVARD